jgi:hypothetical protein
MSLTLAQAEALVRSRTRHPSSTDPRALPAAIRAELNRAYVELRSWLEVVAPELYVATSPEFDLAEGEENKVVLDLTECGMPTSIVRIDRKINEDWRPIRRVSELDPNTPRHGGAYDIGYYRKGNCLIFGPDTCSGGTYRVPFHYEPVALALDADEFKIPSTLYQALVFIASGYQLFNDGDFGDSEKCEERAEAEKKKAKPALQALFGGQTVAGLRMVR